MSNTFQWLWVKKLKQQFECIRPWHSPVSVPDFPEVSMVFHSSRGIYLTQRINARIETVLITHDCPPTYIICNFSLTDASRSASKQADICLLYGISFKNAWCYRKCHNFLKRTWKSVHNVTDCKEDPDQNHRCSKHNLIWQMLMRKKKRLGLEILQTHDH